MTGDVLQGSTTTGLLVAVNNDYHHLYYQGSKEVIVQNLPPGEYSVSVFAIEEDGLPFERAATRTRQVTVTAGGELTKAPN